jgi:hypothetical protein
MYAQVEKPKENKSRPDAISVVQKKSAEMLKYGFSKNKRKNSVVQLALSRSRFNVLGENHEDANLGGDYKNKFYKKYTGEVPIYAEYEFKVPANAGENAGRRGDPAVLRMAYWAWKKVERLDKGNEVGKDELDGLLVVLPKYVEALTEVKSSKMERVHQQVQGNVQQLTNNGTTSERYSRIINDVLKPFLVQLENESILMEKSKKEDVSKNRSAAMHYAALEAQKQNLKGIWRIGEEHAKDIAIAFGGRIPYAITLPGELEDEYRDHILHSDSDSDSDSDLD